jgi:predicted RNA binding protein YcfA (HicA-like mRNA interferase family)
LTEALVQIDKDKIIKSLLKKGFEETSSTHHRMFFHKHQGKETGAKTFISHTPGLKAYNDSLLAKMKGQLKLNSKSELADLLNCPMSGEDYISKLKENGTI